MDCLPEAAITAEVGEPLDFTRRWSGVELMDDPACDEQLLFATLRQFRLLNRLVSRYRSVLGHAVLDDMARAPRRDWHLVDVGAGGCDIPVWLLRAARRRGLSLRVTAIDGDPRAVAFAREAAGSEPGLSIVHADLMDIGCFGPVDYVFSNHVVHHLPDAVIRSFFERMDQTVSRRWVVSDLCRSVWAYAGFQVLGRLFRNSFAFEDGKRSIRRSLRADELAGHLAAIGAADRSRVTTLPPGRLLAVVDVRSA